MRSVAVHLVPLLLLSGCLASDARQDPADDDGQDVTQQVPRSQQLLGDHQVFTPGPGEHTFTARVPAGGAVNVAWRLVTSGVNVDTRIEGPGCSGSSSVAIGQTSSISGSCDDLAAGEHEFAVILNSAVVSFRAEVTGWVQG